MKPDQTCRTCVYEHSDKRGVVCMKKEVILVPKNARGNLKETGDSIRGGTFESGAHPILPMACFETVKED